MLTKKRIEEAAEQMDMMVEFYTQPGDCGEEEKYVEFEFCSPAGEDVIWTEFYDKLDDIPDKLTERYHDFDPEDHAAEWYHAGRGEPSSLAVLLDDAYAQQDSLAMLIRFLWSAAV